MSSVGLVYRAVEIDPIDVGEGYTTTYLRRYLDNRLIMGDKHYRIVCDQYMIVNIDPQYESWFVNSANVEFRYNHFKSINEYVEWLNNRPMVYEGNLDRYDDVLRECGIDHYWVRDELMLRGERSFTNGVEVTYDVSELDTHGVCVIQCYFATVVLLYNDRVLSRKVIVSPVLCDRYTNLHGNFQDIADAVICFLKYSKFEVRDGRLHILTPMADEIDYERVEYLHIPTMVKSARSC